MILFWLIASYLAGSIPTAFIITKIVKHADIRQCGSGNSGATNAFRVAGTIPGILTLVIDLLKGFIPTFLAMRFFGPEHIFIWIFVGLCALSGHIWTIFLNFKGGKGVATGAGVFLALLPIPTIFTAVIFLVVFLLTRYISLSSITGALTLPIISWVMKEPKILCIFVTFVCVLIIIKHHPNIKRLLNGTELKLIKADIIEGK